MTPGKPTMAVEPAPPAASRETFTTNTDQRSEQRRLELHARARKLMEQARNSNKRMYWCLHLSAATSSFYHLVEYIAQLIFSSTAYLYSYLSITEGIGSHESATREANSI